MSVSVALRDVRRIAHGPMRRLFIGQFLNALGSGLTLALLIKYLSAVRGIDLSVATGLLAWQAILALAFSPLAGTLVDRIGPRPVLLGAVLIEAVGVFGYSRVTTVAEAFVVMTVVAIGGAGIWGPSSALTARLVPSADRATAFGFGFMLLNLGLGLGGLIGASIVDVDDPGTFELLYTISALTYVALFVAVLSMGNVGRVPLEEPHEQRPEEPASPTTTPVPGPAEGRVALAAAPAPPRPDDGWRVVLADRTLLRYAAAGLLMLTFGYGSLDAGMAVYITDSVGLSIGFVGVVFAANTLVIVVMQLFVLGLIKGRSRSRTLGGVGMLWGAAWLLFGAASGMPLDWSKLVLLVVAMAVFAFGETLWSPVAPALLNDLAPEHLRGRYNAFQSLLWGVSGALGPVITGAFLDADRGVAWTITLAGGCFLAAVIALLLRRHLTPAQDGVAQAPG
jgi:MFS family permease